jgi:hypothetical protein
MTGVGELAMFLAIGAAAIGLLFGPIGDLRNQLAEVEERLDFAERLLAHGGPENQLPGGAHR